MRRDSFNVLFFIKKTKLLKNGEASVTEFTRNSKRMGNLSLPEYCRKSSSGWTKRWSKYAPSSVLCVNTTSNAER